MLFHSLTLALLLVSSSVALPSHVAPVTPARHRSLGARLADPVALAERMPARRLKARRSLSARSCRASTSSSSVVSEAESTSSSSAHRLVSTSSEVIAPTTSSEAVEPTTSSEVVESTSSSEVVEPTSTEHHHGSTSTSVEEPTSTEAPQSSSTPEAEQSTSTKHRVSTSSETLSTSSTHTHTPTSSSSSPESTGGSSSSGSSFTDGTHTGELTFYSTGLGACGITNTDSDKICAVGHELFDNYPGYDGTNSNNNPICNQKISLTYNGKTIEVTVTDRCVGCAEWDLDLSPSAFDELANESEGRLFGATWTFI